MKLSSSNIKHFLYFLIFREAETPPKKFFILREAETQKKLPQTQGHCMTLAINLTRTLNPTQTLIDQQLYALTKELQFRYLYLLGNHCPKMGALHIEQSLLSIHGQLIEGSSLDEILGLSHIAIFVRNG